MFQDNELVNFQFVCMINLNSILATYPEWGAESAPTFTIWGAKSAPGIQK